MKAYKVFPNDEFEEGCLLAYAENRNGARQLGTRSGLWPGYYYVSFKAIRQPEYDQYYRGMEIIELNSELPADAPEFFIKEA